jgi:EAL domain-containing protein (putative c-di-GMP-specific phosphodiesterase class I)
MEQGKPFSETESPLVDFDAVCQKVRAAVEPARAHAVSLHDEKGDVLWLSESSMGPDEHNAVREAIDSFSGADTPSVLAYDLGDARSAVLLRAVSARRALVGAIMLIMDSRIIKSDERGLVKLMTPKLQRVLADFVGMRPDLEPPAAPAPAPRAAALSSVRSAGKSDPPVRRGAPAALTSAGPSSAKAVNGSAGRNGSAHRPAPARSAPANARPAPPTPSAPIELTLEDSARLPATPPPRTAPPAASRAAPPAAARAAPPAAAPPPASRAAPPAAPHAASPPASRAAPPAAPRAAPLPAPRAAPPAAPRAAPPAAPHAPAPAPNNADQPQKRPQPPVTPEVDRLHAALRSSPIALHVQRLVPLTKGSQLRRYEVLLRSKTEDAPDAAPHAMLKTAVDNGLGSMIDRRVVTELVGWLVHHPDVWQSTAVMFSVNLTATALHDEHFIKFVGLCLAKSSLPKAMIAFEIDVSTAVKLASRVTEVAAALHRLGCPMVLDDFGLRTECFELLRLPGVRYIKLASDITSKMRTDKVSQAAITAVVQMARVLGMHTVAKRTETPAEQEWLTALGVDFVQSNAMSPPAPIDTLSAAKAKS